MTHSKAILLAEAKNTDTMRINVPNPEIQPIRDNKQLNNLRVDMEEAADEVIKAYIDTIREQLENLKAVSANTATDEIRRFAHTIKSSALTIGAMRLAHYGAQLEYSIQDEGTLNIASATIKMEAELNLYLIKN